MGYLSVSDPLLNISTVTAIRKIASDEGLVISEYINSLSHLDLFSIISGPAQYLASPYNVSRIEQLEDEMEKYSVTVENKLEYEVREKISLIKYMNTPSVIMPQIIVSDFSKYWNKDFMDLRPWGGSISKPRNNVWTSSWVSPIGSLYMLQGVVEDWNPSKTSILIHVSFSESSQNYNIYTINSATDWVHLCNQFPINVSDRFYNDGNCISITLPIIHPDWRLVSEVYDAINLTWGGLIDTSLRQLECEQGYTVMNGWSTERTIWLTQPEVKFTPIEPQDFSGMDSILNKILRMG